MTPELGDQCLSEQVSIVCSDGTVLRGHVWNPRQNTATQVAIINPATGVLARYYHRYAAYLASCGVAVITYDYRGIGESRRLPLRRSPIRWMDWGRRDFDAVVDFASRKNPSFRLLAIGHSIGGVLIGAAPRARMLTRILTVGAQYAYWRDYNPSNRLQLFIRWNIIMLALTAAVGYFPGKRIGWLEDLPPNIALEWATRRSRFELNYSATEAAALVRNFAAVRAPITAVHVADDEFTSRDGIERALAYYTGSNHQVFVLQPSNDAERIGHFGFFHERHRETFWKQSISWLGISQ